MALGCEGLGDKCQPWGAQGTKLAWGAWHGLPLHSHPLATDPHCASVSPAASREARLWLCCVGSALGCAGGCRGTSVGGREVGDVGLEEVCVCLWDGQGVGSALPDEDSEAGLYLPDGQVVMVTVLGDGAGATNPITPFPVPFSFPGPAPHGLCSTLRAADPISAKAMTHVPRICASPGPHPAGTGPGHPQAAPRCLLRGLRCQTGQHRRHGAPAELCLPSAWLCREREDLQAVIARARGQQGSESPFRRGHCPLLSI